jgi:hypothetical protein
MGRMKSLMAGVVLGAGGMYGGLQYHLLQAEEGLLIVPRSPQQRLQDAYADIRQWDAATWTARPRLALAVTQHGRGDLITVGASSSVIDELRETFAPLQTKLGEVSQGWEPATTGGNPAPVGTPPSVNAQSTLPARSDPPSVRRGFLPLAELFGIREKPRAVEPTPPQEEHHVTPVLPAGVTRPLEVELLPPPADYEDLGGPSDVQLGPAAPIPGSVRGADRRRSNADGWQPLTVQSF